MIAGKKQTISPTGIAATLQNVSILRVDCRGGPECKAEFLGPTGSKTRLPTMMPDHQDSDAYGCLGVEEMVRKPFEVHAAKLLIDERKAFGIFCCPVDEDHQFIEKLIGQVWPALCR